MEAIKLFDVGPTHKGLVEAALSRNSEIGVEELRGMAPLERHAAALHWYAYELRRNGLTNLLGDGMAPVILEIRGALASVDSDAARTTAGLLSTLEESEEEDAEGTALILSETLDRMLVDAEQYFSSRVRKGLSRSGKIVIALAAVGDTFYALMFLIAYLTRESDGGAWLAHMQRGLPFVVIGNVLYAVLWLPDSRAGDWIMIHWYKLALSFIGLHLAIISYYFATDGDAPAFYLNLLFTGLSVGGVLLFRWLQKNLIDAPAVARELRKAREGAGEGKENNGG